MIRERPMAHAVITARNFIVAAVTVAVAGVVTPTLASVASSQRSALIDLYTATKGSTGCWTTSTGWTSSTMGTNDPCTNAWNGVTCSADGANVVYVGGSGKGLQGS